MRVSIVMNIINVAGNAILIYGFRRGTEGVAIPTLVSRMTAAVLIMALLADQRRPIYVRLSRRYRPDWSMIRKILGIGIPNGLENSMFQLGKIIVLSLVSTFGTYAIAANAVSNVIASFQVLPGMATGILFSYATSEAMQGVPGEQRSTAMGFFQAVYAVGMTTFP